MALIIDRQVAEITNAVTGTTLILTSQAIPTGKRGAFYAKAVINDAPANEAGFIERVAIFKNVAGTVSQVTAFSVGGSPTDDLKMFETDVPSGWTLTFTVSGTQVQCNLSTTTSTAMIVTLELESRITY